MATEDPSSLQVILNLAIGLASACAGGLGLVTVGRIAKVEDRIDAKADKTEVTRHSDDVNNLWSELRTLRQELNDKHIDLLNAINRRIS